MQFIDLLALYKLNVLHLHLSDDQGWRIEIRSRPLLATMGGATQVGGGPGGFYTQADYAEIVRYAQERYIAIVPEIDMPGHTNAALVAHPELSCSRMAPALYTRTEVGWSTLCPNKEETYALIDDVVRELAGHSPRAGTSPSWRRSMVYPSGFTRPTCARWDAILPGSNGSN